MIRIIIYTILISLSFGQFREIPDIVTKVGTAAAPWLKLETGIRAIGMAGAQAASARGISSLPYNPAGIGFVENQEAFLNKTNYLAGISHNVLGYAKRINATDIVGLHVFYLDSGEMIRYDYGGNALGDFKVYNIAVRGSYARIFTDRLKVGFTLKYIREDIWDIYMQTFAIDIGSNFDTGIYGFILGMSVSNFGPEVQFKGPGLSTGSETTSSGLAEKKTEFFPLPMMFRLGVENQIMGAREDALIKSDTHRLIVAADGIKPIDYTVHGSVGLEYAWNEMAFVRCGTHFAHDTAGPSFGLGLHYKGMKFDYAISDYGVLGSTGQFGMEFEF